MPEFNCFRCSLLWGFPIKNFWDKTQFDEHIIVWNGFKVDCCLGAPPGIPNHQPKPLPLVTISWVRKKNNIYYDQLVMWGWPSLVCSWPQKKKMWVFPKIVVSQNNHCFARSISINNNLLNWAQIHSPHIYLLLKPHTHTHTHTFAAGAQSTCIILTSRSRNRMLSGFLFFGTLGIWHGLLLFLISRILDPGDQQERKASWKGWFAPWWRTNRESKTFFAVKKTSNIIQNTTWMPVSTDLEYARCTDSKG